MATVYILIGKIASGKTTWALERKKKSPLVLLSCDDMMLNLFNGCLGEKHSETERRCLMFLFGQAAQLADLGMDAVLDSGFWTKESRKMAKAYFTDRGIKTRLYFFDIPDEIRLDRLEKRNELLARSTQRSFIIDKKLMENLDKKFEAPLPNEYDFIVCD